MKITVVGTGYVGLVSGVCFADIGHQVVCVDKDQDKITKLQNSQIPIYEPGLEQILQKAIKAKKISFTKNLKEAISGSQAIFIAVGTPQDEKTGSADLSFVYSVASEIADNIKDYKVIITKSTVPVGTGQEIKNIIKKANPNAQFSIASNPEFLREGVAIDDFMKPDRVVIGIEDEKSKKIMSQIYAPLAKNYPIFYSDVATSELIKYASNSFLATKIAFINEMANLCEKVGANVKGLSKAVGMDSRIGNKFLNPGPGFGGSCFPKDILALTNMARENDCKLSIIDTIIESNNQRKLDMVDKIIKACDQDVKNKTIAILGLAFKANTDDIRYSPAITIIEELVKKGARIRAYDQEAIKNTQKQIGENPLIQYCNTPYQAAQQADALVIVTEWAEFSNLDLDQLKNIQKQPLIIDLRNMLNPAKVNKAGFKYINIGTSSPDQ